MIALKSLVVLVALLSLLFPLQFAHALIVDENVRTADVVTSLEKFGFDGNTGTLQISDFFSTKTPAIAFALCTRTQWENLFRHGDDFYSYFCKPSNSTVYFFIFIFFYF